MSTQWALLSPRLNDPSEKDSPPTSKDLSFQELGLLQKASAHPPSKSVAKSVNSGRSKYTNNSKLIQSSLFKCLKNQKTSRQLQREQDRNVQIQLLTQSLGILSRKGLEIQITLLENFIEKVKDCSIILIQLKRQE